jgi:hypothetical protein
MIQAGARLPIYEYYNSVYLGMKQVYMGVIIHVFISVKQFEFKLFVSDDLNYSMIITNTCRQQAGLSLWEN